MEDGGRARKQMDGFVEDNGSTQRGYQRSVYSVLTSCSHYPLFVQTFLLFTSAIQGEAQASQVLRICIFVENVKKMHRLSQCLLYVVG